MRLFFLLVFCVLLGCNFLLAQEPQADKVSIPPAPPTVPPNAMYALGQQSGQLTAISAQLNKIDKDVDKLQEDVTRINTVGGLLLLFVVPIVVYRIQRRFAKQPI